MKNTRIVVLEYENFFCGMKKTYALQRRIGLFFWYTVTKCDSVAQCLAYHKNTKNKEEKLINVLRYLD